MSDDDLDCHGAARLISDDLEGVVVPADRERLRRHFVICETCRTVDEQMSFLRQAMRRMGSAGPDATGHDSG